jgi:anaerobic magnesium-protoporphyrin IX monomethyl ester cyclase
MWLRVGGVFVDPIPQSAPGPDISTLPRWDYEVMGGVDRLLEFGVNIFGDRRDRFLPRRASRGCPYDCTFCSAPRWGGAAGYDRHGTRNVWPVEDLCRDLAELRDRHAPDGFEFWDEHFPVDLEWLRELAREYPRRVGLPFRAEMHPSAATPERLELLARAGCVLFHCGVEEGDPEFRRRVLNRRSSDALLQRVFDDVRSFGMETSASVMVACPGETAAQIESTLALLRRLRPDHIFCSKYQPLPGTALGDAVASAPAVQLQRFDEYRQRAPLHDPRSIDDTLHAHLFEQFDILKRDLAAEKSGRSAGRPVDTPPSEQ